MSFAVAHGVRGLEAEHIWNGGLNLNQQLNSAGNATAWPLIRLERITGLHSLPEADDNRAPATARIGEIAYPSLARGRTVTYEGTVYGRTLDELRGAIASMRGSFSDRWNSGTMVVRPHAVLGGVSFAYSARPLAFDVDDEQLVGYEAMPSAYQRRFTLSLRQADPRFYGTTAVGTGSQAAGATPTVTNAGNAPTDFSITVAGPAADDLVFERYGNPDARKLLFNNVGLAGGDSLILNYGARSLRRASDGADFTGKLVFADSHWWDQDAWGLQPGATVIRCAGGGSWSCTFYPASW